MSDTPRTDAAVNAGGIQLLNVAETSRTLERELADAKRYAELLEENVGHPLAIQIAKKAMQKAAP